MSLGLNDEFVPGRQPPQIRHKSPGLAFLFSLLLPGAGQFYCGKTGRGRVTLGFWVAAVLLCFSRQPAWVGMGSMVAFVLWVFSFLDAYYTAIEINAGEDEQVDVQNPRVAVALNLLTAGFGYFYLGERVKGIAFFVGMQIFRLVTPRVTGYTGGVVSLAVMFVQLLMGADAYRIARAQLKAALGSQAEPEPGSVKPASRLPAFVPIGIAGLASAGFFALMIFGLALSAARPGARGAGAGWNRGSAASRTFFPQRSSPTGTRTGPATDLASAVSEVQRIERKTDRMTDDINSLQQDAKLFTSVLERSGSNADDVVVAYFFRAEAYRLINSIHLQQDESVDTSVALKAIGDFNRVIASNHPSYIPAANVTNAQFYAGHIARNHLRNYDQAYQYWEKCAFSGHGGCMAIMANAHVTGEGGQKIDINEALDMHTMVYNTGIRFHCAGARSALSIAEIIYFTGVRRRGDDELEWVKKSDALTDQMSAAQNEKEACGRAYAGAEEFLFELSRGHRKPGILLDAEGRVEHQAATTKALIELLGGSISREQFEATVQSAISERDRCQAYFGAMWHAELTHEKDAAHRYRQKITDIGDFQCGLEQVYAKKFNP
ncbi:MAG TPA: hypothetical protein VF753_19395 [Terriglobales bacterium]